MYMYLYDVVWSGCLSLVPYMLWQVFVLPNGARLLLARTTRPYDGR